MILPRFRFLTISSKKLWIWKNLENGSPRKKKSIFLGFFNFFFRGCILQVFRDPAFFRRFWPGFFFSRNRECDHRTGVWWAMTWEGRVRDPQHRRSGTVPQKHSMGGFVFHDIRGGNSWFDFSDAGLLGSQVTTALRCDGRKNKPKQVWDITWMLSSVSIDLFHQSLGSNAFWLFNSHKMEIHQKRDGSGLAMGDGASWLRAICFYPIQSGMLFFLRSL